MLNTEFHIEGNLIKCVYTITEKGNDPDAPDFTVFNIDYTITRGENTFGPYPIKIYVGKDILTIGKTASKDSTRSFMVNFKNSFMDTTRKKKFLKFYNDNAD